MLQRSFRESDLPVILEFKKESSSASFHGESINLTIFQKRFLHKVKKEPGGVQVIEDQGRVVAYIWVSTHRSILGLFGRIEHTFVTKEYRGKGIATTLKLWAEQYFKEKGIHRIQSTVSMENTTLLKLNRKLGYVEKRIVMEKNF